MPGHEVTKQGEFNDQISFLGKGFIEVFKSFDKTDLFYIETYEQGKMFGEVSAVLGCRSDVTTVCKNYCKIGRLSQVNYESIVTKYPTL